MTMRQASQGQSNLLRMVEGKEERKLTSSEVTIPLDFLFNERIHLCYFLS